MNTISRIGLIVPSSNTTMETEVPRMIRSHKSVHPDQFTFHSARMRMQKVTKEELARMNQGSSQCALALADARVDVIASACLVAIMSMGNGYHRESERELSSALASEGAQIPVVTSAGALISGLRTLGAKSIAVIMPYMKPLADMVVDYIEHEGINVSDSLALGIESNLEVGCRDPQLLLKDLDRLDTSEADVVVLSACVQMPSLTVVSQAEDICGLPVVSAATATTRCLLDALEIEAKVPSAGALLA